MSLVTPTTAEINANIIAQIEANLNQTIPLLPKSFNRVISKVFAGIFILLFKYAGFIFLQLFVSKATFQDVEINGVVVNPLKEWGRLVGAGDPVAATQAELLVDVTVTTQSGSLSAGSQLIGETNSVTYITLVGVLLDSPTVQVTVRAAGDQSGGDGSGVVGNLEPGDSLSFANPLPNVARNATVSAQSVTAAEAEGAEVYRKRIQDLFQRRPQGGAYTDYKIWGESVAGIINCYPYSGLPGQVDVYSEATVASSGSPDGIPTTAQLQAVLDAINFDSNGLSSQRPATAFVNSYPITRAGFDVNVTGISGVADLTQVRADITTALANYFLSLEPFILGLSLPPEKNKATQTRIIGIVDDVVNAAGGTFVQATFSLTGSGVDLPSYEISGGEKAKLVDMAWV